MKSNLGQFDFKSNAIGFLRIVFAANVVWAHGWRIAGLGADPLSGSSAGWLPTGYLAVCGFFVLSGFLITRSGENTSGPIRFTWHRVLRIYPGFWACLIATACVIAPLIYAVQYGSLQGFLTANDGPLGYIYKNATLIIAQPAVGNLKPYFPFEGALNSSLWTLIWEFFCYLCIGIFGAFSIYRFPKLSLVAVVLPFAALFYDEMAVYHSILKGFVPSLGLLTMFGIGSAAYLFRHRIRMLWSLAIVALGATVFALPTPLCQEIVPFSFAYLTLYAAMFLPIRSFDRHIDLSYGLYLYGMPALKLAVLFGFASLGFPAYFAIVLAAGLAFAGVSWFVIERPALRLRSLRLPAGFARFRRPAQRYGNAGS